MRLAMRQSILLMVISTLLVGMQAETTTPQPPVQPSDLCPDDNWSLFDMDDSKSCYMHKPGTSNSNFQDAIAVCEQYQHNGHKAHLPIIDSIEENEFVSNLMVEQGVNFSALALEKLVSNSEFEWLDGESRNFANWETNGNEPNLNWKVDAMGVISKGVDGQWISIPTFYLVGVVCEFDNLDVPEPPPEDDDGGDTGGDDGGDTGDDDGGDTGGDDGGDTEDDDGGDTEDDDGGDTGGDDGGDTGGGDSSGESKSFPWLLVILGSLVVVVCIAGAFLVYIKRDLLQKVQFDYKSFGKGNEVAT